VKSRRYAAWPALAAVLAVGACSGGDDPPATSSTSGSSSSSSTSSTTTSSPSTTATTTVQVPAAAQKHTPAGAEAFVRFYIDQSNEASMKADVTLLPPLSDPGCKSCEALQTAVEELKTNGTHYDSAPVTISKATAIDGGPKGQQFVRVLMVQNKTDVVDATGKVVSTDPRADLARTFSTTWMGERWVLFGIAQ
jgi:RNase P subunit RPR2